MFASCARNVKALRNNARSFSDMVRIVEAGARDGLQNLRNYVPAEIKIELINRLSETGLRSIEATSFVSPEWVPQMADGVQVYECINKNPNVDYSVLVPNMKGLEKAIELNVKEVYFFTAASETFNRKNVNCSIEESLKKLQELSKICKEKKIKARVAVSCIAGCPYEGEVPPAKVAQVCETLLKMGFYEISLGDTIGIATPKRIANVMDALRAVTGGDIWRFAMHCHDTYGQSMANIYECLNQGIRVFDGSVAGLGGCPFAPGASGNVSTEDLVYLMHGEGMQTGIDLEKLVQVGDYISQAIPVPNNSRAGTAMLAKKRMLTKC